MGVSDVLANLVHQPVPLTLYLIGTLSWAVAVIAAAVALSQAGARRTAAIPLALAGVIGAIDHALCLPAWPRTALGSAALRRKDHMPTG